MSMSVQNKMATLIAADEKRLAQCAISATCRRSQSSDCSMALDEKPDCMNHKQWRAHLKKMKRKKKRTELAKEREAAEPAVEENLVDSEEERRREEEEEEQSLRKNLLWMQREREAQAAFKAKKDWEEKEKLRKEEIERKIKEEWAERERKEREEQEEKEKKETERREKQKKLLQEATANENKEPWHNPIGPVQYSQEKKVDHCPFFKKTATCRFGEECSRYHDYPESSTTILIPRMFSSIELEQSSVDALDADMSLEFEDGDLYQSFRDFYWDVVPEFKTVGTVIQLKVCCNHEPHLKGNVYVQYRSESSAHKAYEKFNARWYGGRQLTCIFVNIESWKAAICGLAFKKRCPKGKHCNFLHVFCNPGGEFADMDHDNPYSERREYGSRRGYRLENGRSWRQGSYRGDDQRRDRRSESIRSSRSSRHRSRSQDRRGSYRDRSRSRSPSKGHWSNSKSTHSSSSKSRSSAARNRSRSKSLERSSRANHRSRSRSKSLERSSRANHRSRSRSKSLERSSRANHRSRSRSKSLERSSRANQRSRSRSKSLERSSRANHRSRSRSKSLERSSRANHRSRSRSKHRTSAKRHISKSPSNEKHSKFHKSRSSTKKRHKREHVSKSPDRRKSKSRSRSREKERNGVKSKSSEKTSSSPLRPAFTSNNSSNSSGESSDSSSSSSSSDSEMEKTLETAEAHKSTRVSSEKDRTGLTDTLSPGNVNNEEIKLVNANSTPHASSELSPPLGQESSSQLGADKSAREKSKERVKKKRKIRKRSKSEESESEEEYVYVEKTKDSIES